MKWYLLQLFSMGLTVAHIEIFEILPVTTEIQSEQL